MKLFISTLISIAICIPSLTSSQNLTKFSSTTSKKTTKDALASENIVRFKYITNKTSTSEGRKDIIHSVISDCFYSLSKCQDRLYLGDIVDFNRIDYAFKGVQKTDFYDLHGSRSAFLWSSSRIPSGDLDFYGSGMTHYTDAADDVTYHRYFYSELGESMKNQSKLTFEFNYDHIQREPNTYAKVVMKKTGFKCTRTGCYDDEKYLGSDRCEDFAGHYSFFGGYDYLREGDYEEKIECTIIIYPLIFETDYFFMESEMGNPWASDVYEALFYILLHEFGHIAHYWVENTMYYTATIDLNTSEEAASNFASSVWRECE